MARKEYSYTVLIEEDNGVFIATVPAFDGCVVQMDTYKDAVKEIKKVLKDFISLYKAKGMKLPHPEEVKIKVAV